MWGSLPSGLWPFGILGALACSAAVASAQPQEKEAGPCLRWEFSTRPIPDGGGKEQWYFQKAVTLADEQGKSLWRVELPRRMGAYQAGIGEAEVQAHKEYPRQAARDFPFLCGIAWLPDAVVIADLSGLLVLRLTDGKTLLDAENPGTDQPPLYFDNGTYEIKGDGQAWSGEGRRGKFLAVCGRRLVCFDGNSVAVYGVSPYRLEERVPYAEKVHRQPAKFPRVSARFRVGGVDVTIEGIIFM